MGIVRASRIEDLGVAVRSRSFLGQLANDFEQIKDGLNAAAIASLRTVDPTDLLTHNLHIIPSPDHRLFESLSHDERLKIRDEIMAARKVAGERILDPETGSRVDGVFVPRLPFATDIVVTSGELDLYLTALGGGAMELTALSAKPRFSLIGSKAEQTDAAALFPGVIGIGLFPIVATDHSIVVLPRVDSMEVGFASSYPWLVLH